MGSLSTRFTANGTVDAAALARARQELASQGVSKVDENFGIVFVTYDPSRISYHALADRLRSLGVPVS